MRELTQGSHFDGISAFPLAASRYGIKTIWATEIEAFPVAVSKHHFPDVRHYGDITQVSGYDLEPVDIITFGSPCQDWSVAGKREGLYGERSGLFMEATRTIREMREATNGKYPRFAIWENVPGAFSSNRGFDFKAVLEEITESKIPMPESGKWATAGMVRGDGRSVTWRTLDAQRWGTPQRRRRIFLVADFAGQRAPEILFECQGMSGDFTEGRKAGQEVAASARDGVETTSQCLTPWDVQSKRIHKTNGEWPALYSGKGGGGAHGYMAIPINTQIATRHNKLGRGTGFALIGYSEYSPGCGPLRYKGGGCGGGSETLVVFGPGGQHDIAHAVRAQPSRADKPSSTTYVVRTAQTSANGHGIAEEKAHTLDGAQWQAVCYDPKDLGRRPATFEDKSPTIKARCGTGGNNITVTQVGYAVRRLTPTECERLQGFPDDWTLLPGASDTARYKAIGNSIAVPCLEWIYSQLVKVTT